MKETKLHFVLVNLDVDTECQIQLGYKSSKGLNRNEAD